MRRILAVIAASAAASAGAAYKCVDERGLTLIGETPPDGCAKVVMYEVSNTGKVLRRIDPTPTPEQVKRLEEERAKRLEAERAAAEQKRKDQALVNTYSSEHEIDVTRERNIAPIRSRIAAAEERMVASQKRQQELEEQLEFYRAGKRPRKDGKANEPPPALVADLERLKKEQSTLARVIESARKEITATEERYDADRKRWMQVKGLAAPSTAAESRPVKGGY